MVEVGQKVRFDPFYGLKGQDINSNSDCVTGIVVAVYERNKWFSVEWGDPKQRTSFKFCDIGDGVTICGRC